MGEISSFLVSNLGETAGTGTEQFAAGIRAGIAQSFTTGAASTLHTVQIDGGFQSGSQVSIYSNSGGFPGTSLSVLQNPSTLDANTQVQEFDAGAGGLGLAASTPYHVVVNGTGTIRYTSSDTEDGAAGWSIGDSHSLQAAEGELGLRTQAQPH